MVKNIKMIKSRPMFTIAVTVFLDQLGYSIFLPILPLIFSDPHSAFYILSGNVSGATGLLLMGLLIGTYPAAQFFVTPILGYLSDSVGRKKILFISIFGTFLSYLLAAYAIFSKNLPLLFGARIIDGLTGGNISVAQAVITDLSDKKALPKNFGLIMAMAGLGLIVGPFIGSLVSNPTISPLFNATTPFLFIAGLYLINTFFVAFLLPETLKVKKIVTQDFLKPLRSVFKVFSYRNLWSPFAARFAYSAGTIFFTNFIGAYLIFRYAFSSYQLGNLYAYVGIWLVITQGILIRFIPKKLTEDIILKIFLLTGCVSMLLFLMPGANKALALITPPLAVSLGLVDAYLLAYISKRTSENLQGEVLGIMASLKALAQAVSPVAAGLVAAHFSLNWTIFAAGAIVFVAWLFFFMKKESVPV